MQKPRCDALVLDKAGSLTVALTLRPPDSASRSQLDLPGMTLMAHTPPVVFFLQSICFAPVKSYQLEKPLSFSGKCCFPQGACTTSSLKTLCGGEGTLCVSALRLGEEMDPGVQFFLTWTPAFCPLDAPPLVFHTLL